MRISTGPSDEMKNQKFAVLFPGCVFEEGKIVFKETDPGFELPREGAEDLFPGMDSVMIVSKKIDHEILPFALIFNCFNSSAEESLR